MAKPRPIPPTADETPRPSGAGACARPRRHGRGRSADGLPVAVGVRRGRSFLGIPAAVRGRRRAGAVGRDDPAGGAADVAEVPRGPVSRRPLSPRRRAGDAAAAAGPCRRLAGRRAAVRPAPPRPTGGAARRRGEKRPAGPRRLDHQSLPRCHAAGAGPPPGGLPPVRGRARTTWRRPAPSAASPSPRPSTALCYPFSPCSSSSARRTRQSTGRSPRGRRCSARSSAATTSRFT